MDSAAKKVTQGLEETLKAQLANIPGIDRNIEVRLIMQIPTAQDEDFKRTVKDPAILDDLNTSLLEVRGVDPGLWVLNAAVLHQSTLNRSINHPDLNAKCVEYVRQYYADVNDADTTRPAERNLREVRNEPAEDLRQEEDERRKERRTLT